MPLVVSSLTGDASDMFDWICSVSPHFLGAEEHGREPTPGSS